MANLYDTHIHPNNIKVNLNSINFSISKKNDLFLSLPYNVAIFSKNKHHHLKNYERFVKSGVTKWILLFDKRPTVFDDFQSLYLIRDVDEKGLVRIQYTEQEMNQIARTEVEDGQREYTQTLQRINVPENSGPINPTKAGVLSRIRHAYDRKIEKWQRPKNKPPSLSRTRTFTKVRIRPEEHFTNKQRMEFLKAFGGGGNEIGITSPETSLAPKQRFKRMFGLDSKKKARDEYRVLAKKAEEEKRKEKERKQENQSASL